jgi:hypothetical protein
MAFEALTPGTMNLTMIPGIPVAIQSAVINSLTGTPMNFSSWFSFAAEIAPPSPSPTGANTTFGTVTGSSGGQLTLQTSGTDLENAASGTARLIITGKAATGDTAQLLATGTVTIINPAA